MSLNLLIGLGNPGRKYSKTRHNIGFVILDELAAKLDCEIKKKKFKGSYLLEEFFGKKICLLKPQNFMNLSGEVADSFVNYFKIETKEMLVVHDDIDLPLGKLRFSFGSGHAGHNGIRSILDWIYTKDFYRLRFGVGRPPENIDPADYVLGKFSDDEKRAVDEAVKRAIEAIRIFYIDSPKEAMQIFNS